MEILSGAVGSVVEKKSQGVRVIVLKGKCSQINKVTPSAFNPQKMHILCTNGE